MLDLRPTPFDHPDAVLLTGEVQAYYLRIYGGTDATVDPLEFVAPYGLFLVGYVAGEPVACGGWRARGDDGDPDPVLRPGDAEIKRMYVREAHRGRGHARTLLAELERTAAAAGRMRAVLETGVPQADAIALYARAGYQRIPSFGPHRDSPTSRCFAKDLRRPDLDAVAAAGRPGGRGACATSGRAATGETIT